jgi:AcrR family transcriptional regulator
MAGVKGQVQQRGVERRQQIVDAAIDLFATKGFRGTGVAEVATAVGIAPSAIIHHFGSKEGLLEAVIAERDARTSAGLARLADARAADGLLGMILIAEEVERDRRLAGLYTVLEVENLYPEQPAHKFFVARSRLVRKSLENMLRAGIDSGDLRDDVDVSAVAGEALAFMEGAQLVWLLDPKRHSLTALYRGYFTRLVATLGL